MPRVLAISKNPGNWVEDPLGRPSPMLQDYRRQGVTGFGLS